MGMKKRLLDMYETVYSYFSQWNVISTLVSDQVALRKYKEDGISQKQVEWSLFFADCHAFMESAENLLDQKNYMGQILKCMPLYMTRDKYYDNVQASLSAAFAGESKEFIEASLKAFEGFCSPQENPVYGKYFPEVAEWIGQKRMVLPHKMNDDELSEFYEELKEMYEVLEQIEEAAHEGEVLLAGTGFRAGSAIPPQEGLRCLRGQLLQGNQQIQAVEVLFFQRHPAWRRHLCPLRCRLD